MRQNGTAALAAAGIRYVEHLWVPMPDGVRLSASLWMPQAAEAKPVPAVLEIIPYRKRDHTAARDWGIHSFLAQQGFAGMRVDMRGTGDSEGLDDAHQTYADAVQVLAWLRQQPWCDGNLGMVGLSWGGINALMAAEQRPEGLKAVVATAFSHDRYAVGMARKNGAILNENLVWAASCTGFTSRPQDPLVVGEGWRELWLQRLRNMPLYVQDAIGRQRRDEYYDKHRAHDLAGITAAFAMFSGQSDSNYAQTLPHLMERLTAPRRAVLGPWCHKYPHQAQPGPAIDFLGEAVAWFDHHLRGGPAPAESGSFMIFVAEDLPVKEFYPEAPGRWVALPAWPPQQPDLQAWYLAQGRLQQDAPAAASLAHLSPQDTGIAGGEVMPWFAYAPGPELPGDQRPDDGRSLCFDSAPLQEAFEYAGAPEIELDFEVDQPAANLVVRLCDVKPDGSSARVNLGIWNLCQVESDRNPVPLVPGKRYRMRLKLDVRGYRFLPGHRIRVAISTSYWPLVWPTAQPVTLTVHLGGSRFLLPRLQAAPRPAGWQPFGAPRTGVLPQRSETAPVRRRRRQETDIATGETVLTIEEDNGTYRLDELDWSVSSTAREVYRIRPDAPQSAAVDVSLRWGFARGDWKVGTEIDFRLTADGDAFTCAMRLRAHEGGETVFEREQVLPMPRLPTI